ncbi:UvrD-helicase domain-containing protein [Hymenobacter sp. BT186]|uniref:DNA 3'-5' helicase n=1 Tax=Hymenobacter telluris TaxID=2816474 RepID=A0A939JCZ0_9BACT|nr:ATP-dependent helicase [Hymenobacter telluris]MBO0360701.1 UvrD-helicase domain-containing protein [Hymenobacter telluris]MBW3376728.1 UvrD-helicase domain-containing protein [Hymenobacter norwichensis]
MERIGELAYNPVREHIRMSFERVKEEAQQAETVVRNLQEKTFDASVSRVLIFVRTRRRAEEAVQQLSELAAEAGLPWAEQIDYFHAGLDGFDRERKYAAYQTGETVVLVATKAFGMGMDIKNIHYVYHLGPSSAFEDFLQEVGRAGRNRAALEAAGFSEAHPIQAVCVMASRDFQVLRDLQHKSALSWEYVLKTQQLIHQYAQKYRELDTLVHEPLALPLDLWQRDADEKEEDDVRFRLALHWLELLGRIRLGLFTPSFLPLLLLEKPSYLKIKDDTERAQMQQFIAQLHASKYREATAVSMPMEELKALSGKSRHAELFRFLFLAQKIKAISIDRKLHLELTQLREAELKAWQESRGNKRDLPLVESVFLLAEHLLAPIAPQTQRSLDGNELDRLVGEVAAEHLQPDHIYWTPLKKGKPVDKKTTAKDLAADWREKRAKFALKLVRLLPNTRLQSVMNVRDRSEPGVTQLIYNGNRHDSLWRKPLAELKKRLLALLQYVTAQTLTGEYTFNYADMVVALELEEAGVDYLDNLLFLARALGYIKGGGSFMPMGIELFLLDQTVPDYEDQSSRDYQTHQQFLEGAELKKLRLLALECLAAMPHQKQDAFIKQYFACEGSADLVGLLADHLGADHAMLRAFRQEALKDAEEKLSAEQRQVYDAPLSDNLQVIAGPGSGKTHTLTLRVARLIQKNNIPPDQILVLAYNRAVVVELKDRLSTLFRALGYGQLIKRLHVYTFHGLCRRCLQGELEGVEFSQWVPQLARALAHNPRLIRQQLGPVEYVFVDEFQDITGERLAMLKTIAPVDSAKLCVIGDPNQSIYGYERVAEGGEVDPYPYYAEFEELYQPQKHYLSNNYRSYPGILQAAARLLANNPDRFSIPPLQPVRKPARNMGYCELLSFRETKTDWKVKLDELLTETEYEPGKRYQQVAVMLRSNDEVFRAFNELQSRTLPPDVALRIQGASNSPVTSREFQHLLQPYQQNPEALLSPNYLQEFARAKQQTLQSFAGAWDEYLIHLVHCLVREFRVEQEDDATNQDLLDFIDDMARRDDGHFMKLYEKHMPELVPGHSRREVVLTTMHKVKGLEFDAVLIPPSFADFAADWDGRPVTNLRQVAEEERRLVYVAYTRARYRLAVIQYDREAAVQEGRAYQLANKEQRLGRIVKPGLDKLFISWGAREDRTYEFIRHKIKIGDPVKLVKVQKAFNGKSWVEWQLWCNGWQVGQLRTGAFKQEPRVDQLLGLAVSGISYYTYQDSQQYDEKHNTDYTLKNWRQNAVTRGHIYLVDFAGYYKE